MKQLPLHSLYIHWPFCSSKCYYCDFVAFEQHEDYQDAYHEALCKEIALRSAALTDEQRAIKTIFIGGGTPSLYPIEQFSKLFDTLRAWYNLDLVQEITLEANPADITEERLDAWLEAGVNRISCGVQILDDTALARLNRRQRVLDVERAITLLPKYFDNCSMDLIAGLPGVSDTRWQETVNRVVQWPLKHLSLYFLTIHEKTPLYFKIQRGELTPADDATLTEQYLYAVNAFAERDFIQYEISNFAKPGYQSLHNASYWQRKPYFGFGLGASSFDGTTRFSNEKNLTNYLTMLKGNAITYQFHETLTPEQEHLEIVMLGMRQTQGMHLTTLLQFQPEANHTRYRERINDLISAGLLTNHNDQIALTIRGMIVENEVILKLL